MPLVSVYVAEENGNPLYTKILLIKDDDLVGEFDRESHVWSMGVRGSICDKVVIVVAGLEQRGNYRLVIKPTLLPGLHIQSPTKGNPAWAGDPASPEKFVVQVDVVDGGKGSDQRAEPVHAGGRGGVRHLPQRL